MKNSLWTFANVASTVCVSDDAVCFRGLSEPIARANYIVVM